MKKILPFFLFSMLSIHAGFWPDFSFSYEHGEGNIDKNFVRDKSNKIVLDKRSQKFYYDAKPSPKLTYQEAIHYCQKMNYLGYTKWRVPTKEEMRSLLELSRRDITIKHAFKHVKPAIYWSSTKDRDKEAWYFDLDLGRYWVADMQKKFHVLCVGEKK